MAHSRLVGFCFHEARSVMRKAAADAGNYLGLKNLAEREGLLTLGTGISQYNGLANLSFPGSSVVSTAYTRAGCTRMG
jgi:hypothetical protein